eukprot:1635900-Pleurochrysis_carterae.AAC.1
MIPQWLALSLTAFLSPHLVTSKLQPHAESAIRLSSPPRQLVDPTEQQHKCHVTRLMQNAVP